VRAWLAFSRRALVLHLADCPANCPGFADGGDSESQP
jgi:hypothetical protein